MIPLNLYEFCKTIKDLYDSQPIEYSETESGAVLSGEMDIHVRKYLKNIGQFVKDYNLSSIKLFLDGQEENWDTSVLDDIGYEEWKLSISDKNELLISSDAISIDMVGLLFFNHNYFKDKWLTEASGLINPETSNKFNTEKPIKIFVHELSATIGGSKLAIIPTNMFNEELPSEWLKSSTLPDVSKIKKNVHIVSQHSEFVSPERYILTWGDINSEIAQFFHKAATSTLFLCLVQEYYHSNHVVLNGKRRIESSLVDKKNSNSANKISALKKIVSWCYSEDDETTRILLIADRLSLETSNNQSLQDLTIDTLNSAYKEATSRYKYVVLDRKTEYTKELSDLQKDFSAVADKFNDTVSSYINGFLKDVLALALALILTASAISKGFVDKNILMTSEANLLFKSFSIYLLISLLLRLSNSLISVKLSRKLLLEWRDIIRSHMSGSELDEIFNKTLWPFEFSFCIQITLISGLYLMMIWISWNFQFLLELFNI